MSRFRGFSLLLLAASIVLLLAKAGLNYSGVCTGGLPIWKWHRLTSDELLLALHERATTTTQGFRTTYTIPKRWDVPGDEYQPATFMDKITGRAFVIVRYHQHWRDNEQNLHSGGYFYAPNCIAAWRPPR
jgi:hypothetical protein